MRINLLILAFTTLINFGWSQNQSEIKIISRAEWGAKEPKSGISTYQKYGLVVPEYTKIVLHVTEGLSTGYGKRIPQQIQSTHRRNFKWDDIGYNFIIDTKGNIYQGRSLDYVPSHAGQTEEANREKNILLDPDYASIGIVFSNNGEQPLTASQVEATKSLIAYLIDKKCYPINKIITHAEVKNEIVNNSLTPIGEYEKYKCPGAGTYEGMVKIREYAQRNHNIKFDKTGFESFMNLEGQEYKDYKKNKERMRKIMNSRF